jgi:hypothetical protein
VTAEAAALLRQALTLAPEERADLAAELLASLEPAEDPEPVRRLWTEEMERRADRFLSGDSPGINGETVFKELADKLAQVKNSAG